MMRIILASASPRRKQLLEGAGVNCQVIAADIDESSLLGELPLDYVQRLSLAKASAVAAMQPPASLAIVAADTIVCLGNTLFGKPSSQADAYATWQALSGKTHQVITSVSVVHSAYNYVHTFSTVTEVVFACLSPQQMDWYWHTGEPQDKAGAYAIQGLGGQFVLSIHGSYTGVVGLPLHQTIAALHTLQSVIASHAAT